MHVEEVVVTGSNKSVSQLALSSPDRLIMLKDKS